MDVVARILAERLATMARAPAKGDLWVPQPSPNEGPAQEAFALSPIRARKARKLAAAVTQIAPAPHSSRA